MKCSVKNRSGKNHYAWKGNKVEYRGLHKWVEKNLGKPLICEHCGKKENNTKMMHWANKSGEYKRDLKDWLRLCVRCHRKFDLIKS